MLGHFRYPEHFSGHSWTLFIFFFFFDLYYELLNYFGLDKILKYLNIYCHFVVVNFIDYSYSFCFLVGLNSILPTLFFASGVCFVPLIFYFSYLVKNLFRQMSELWSLFCVWIIIWSLISCFSYRISLLWL